MAFPLQQTMSASGSLKASRRGECFLTEFRSCVSRADLGYVRVGSLALHSKCRCQAQPSSAFLLCATAGSSQGLNTCSLSVALWGHILPT